MSALKAIQAHGNGGFAAVESSAAAILGCTMDSRGRAKDRLRAAGQSAAGTHYVSVYVFYSWFIFVCVCVP